MDQQWRSATKKKRKPSRPYNRKRKDFIDDDSISSQESLSLTLEPNVNEVEKDDAILENEVAETQEYLRSNNKTKKTKAKTLSSENAEASVMTPYDL